MTAPQLHLPRTVASDQTERAVDLLQLYFKSRKFIGSQWDGFDPSGTRAASANEFTSDDVASAALLNTPVPGHAVVHLLITQRERFAGLLEAVGPDCQGPLSSAHRRPVFLPAGGHQNCPLVASWFARLGGGAGHRDGISSVA
ncbi:DUF6308 family protein [Micrococcus luteus]|nr:DUF6308 family protein [Micrococcus luteus]